MMNNDNPPRNIKDKEAPLADSYPKSEPVTPSEPSKPDPFTDDKSIKADTPRHKGVSEGLDSFEATYSQKKGKQLKPDSEFDEIEEEVGTTEAGRQASAALIALGRAARSFLLYEPYNKAIRGFLEDMRKKMNLFLDEYGEMVLEIRPWEMVLGSEVVYINRDRERSLSFRLFRDGVRKVTIAQDVEWEELTKFLGIISVRYTGIRQQEDDIVVLLWKAGFQHITVESVEGFVPEDDDVEVDAAVFDDEETTDSARAIHSAGPEGFDVPWPEYNKRTALNWAEIDPERLKKLAEEDSSLVLPIQCVRVLKEILETAISPVEPMSLEEVVPIVHEIRDFLLSEGLLSSLLEVMRLIRNLPFHQKDEEHKVELLEAFSDSRALTRVIRSVSAGMQEVPPELIELVEMMPGDHVSLLLEILNNERTKTARWVTRNLLVRVGNDQLDYLVDAVYQVEAPVAVDLLQVVADIDLEMGVRVALVIGAQADTELQIVALSIMERGPYSERVGQKLIEMLEAGSFGVRMRALKLLTAQKESSAFNAVTQILERNADKKIDRREVEALGLAMLAARKDRAFDQFAQWVQPRKFLQRMLPGKQNLKWAAVTGLSQIPGEQAEEYIRMVAKTAADDLYHHCMQSLVRHRRLDVEVLDA
ncbi:MAG: hypothetical protein PVJ50_01105 [Desulfobacterales bacterium]|jgi:hypothetical protein